MIQIIQESTKIFISHSSKDKAYADALVELLEHLGFDENNLFCSSIFGYGIPLGEDIYEYLKNQFNTYNLHVIFMLSENYYKSIACLNEMGAAWILHNSYTTILLPGFTFEEIKGAVNPNQISLKLDGDLDEVKERLGQLKNNFQKTFGLNPISDIRWEKKRDDFIRVVLNIFKTQPQNATTLSDGALDILKVAGLDSEICMINNLDGTTIQVNKVEVFSSLNPREIKTWEGYINDLLKNKLIDTQIDVEGFKSFKVTQNGLHYVDNLKKDYND